MSLVSRLIGWAAKLVPADTYDVAIERNIPVPMRDGIMLLASISSVDAGGARRTYQTSASAGSIFLERRSL